jgi:hypothetical protein
MKKLLLIILLTLSFSSVAEVRCGGDLWNLQEVITPRISPTIDTPEIKETKPFLRLECKY